MDGNGMHVFIDTNILLSFFHFSKDELDALSTVFGSHKHGSATVHLTDQVFREFRRNREGKIKEAIKRFDDAKPRTALPSFMKTYDEYDEIQKLTAQLNEKLKAIRERADTDIAARTLSADLLIRDIMEKSSPTKVTPAIVGRANMRVATGDPPGKKGSIGDAINWLTLLETVPDGQPLHLISEDGDFYSCLDEKRADPFLVDEWSELKKSDLCAYRTLSAFTKEHFDGIAFSFDKDKDELIDQLNHSWSYASSHGLVASLEKYGYFSQKEVERILNAAESNSQFGDILHDDDVVAFLSRIASAKEASLSDKHRALIKELKEWEANWNVE
jgi:hypothetical protein